MYIYIEQELRSEWRESYMYLHADMEIFLISIGSFFYKINLLVWGAKRVKDAYYLGIWLFFALAWE